VTVLKQLIRVRKAERRRVPDLDVAVVVGDETGRHGGHVLAEGQAVHFQNLVGQKEKLVRVVAADGVGQIIRGRRFRRAALLVPGKGVGIAAFVPPYDSAFVQLKRVLHLDSSDGADTFRYNR